MITIYLDDLRTPEWASDIIIVRCPNAFKDVVVFFGNTGMKYVLSFDNDLGLQTEGRHLFSWLEEQVEYGLVTIPYDIIVHSANPAAKREIERGRDAMYQRHFIK